MYRASGHSHRLSGVSWLRETSKKSTQLLEEEMNIFPSVSFFLFSFHCFSYICPSCVCKSQLNRAGGHPPLFLTLSNWFTPIFDPTVSWPFLLCVLLKQSSSKCSTQIPFSISIIVFSKSVAGFSWLSRWCTRGSHHHCLLFFQSTFGIVYFCLLFIIQSLIFKEKFVYFKRRWHVGGKEDRAGLQSVASSI